MARTETSPEDSQVGDILRRKREELSLDVEGIGASGGPDPQTIRALERDDPAGWAGDPRMLGALRIYARHLGLVAEPLVADAWQRAGGRQEHAEAPRVEPLRPGPAYPHAPRSRRRVLGMVVLAAIVLASAALVVIANQTGRDVSAGGPTAADPPALSGDEAQDGEGAEGDVETGEVEGDAEGADGEGAAVDGLPGRPPQGTRVQVLDALGDGQATAEAADQLESLGYEVVLVDTTAQPWPESVVLHEEGWDVEAQSLAARTERFEVGGPNTSFVDDADLHVVVGLDWVAP